MEFQDVVVSIDQQKILAAFSWGLSIKDRPDSKVEESKPKRLDDLSKIKEVLAKAKEAQGKKIRLGDKEVVIRALDHFGPKGEAYSDFPELISPKK